MACDCSDCRIKTFKLFGLILTQPRSSKVFTAEGIVVISLFLFLFKFFLNAFQSFLLQLRFWSFIQVSYHFLMVAMHCAKVASKWLWLGKKPRDSELFLPTWLYTPQLGIETDLVHPYFICMISRFLFCFINFLIAFQS